MTRKRRLALGLGGLALGLVAAGELGARALTAPARRTFPAPPGFVAARIRGAGGARLGAWRVDTPGARGTVVFGHGYRSDRRQFERLVPAFTRRGFRALLFDFQAHGESEGARITMGPREARDVAAALDHAATLGGPVYYVGFSMGAAAYLLSGREARAAVLDSPYDALDRALAARAASAGLPPLVARPLAALVGWRMPVAPARARPVDAVARLRRPVMFVFAERDHWVPPDAQARYRAALPPGARFELLRGRGHGDHTDAAWAERAADFLATAR